MVITTTDYNVLRQVIDREPVKSGKVTDKLIKAGLITLDGSDTFTVTDTGLANFWKRRDTLEKRMGLRMQADWF